MALFSKKSEHARPEQVKEASQSPGAQSSQSRAKERSAPASQASVRQVYLDRDSKIEGKLIFKRSVRVDGQIDGEILAKDLIIGESGLITAQIKAASVIVAGTINGDIIASQSIEIRASAKISGKLTSPILVMHEGAAFEGRCAMQSDKAHAVHKSAVAKDELAAEQTKDRGRDS